MRFHRLAATAGLALALAGCGIPTDDAPREFTVADEGTDADGGSDFAEPNSPTATIFLVESDTATGLTRLAPQQRTVPPAATDEAYLRQLLEELVNATPSGLQNLTTSVRIEDVTIDDRTALVVLTGLNDVVGSGQLTATAQIVFTATEIEGIDGVEFVRELDDGTFEEVQVPVEDGTSTAGAPVTRDDFPTYRDLLSGDLPATTSTEPTTTAPPATLPSDSVPSDTAAPGDAAPDTAPP